MRRAKGKITRKKSGSGGYESIWIYIPSKIAKDSTFPFSTYEDVNVEIIDDKLMITKRDELFDIIENYGVENATIAKLLRKKAAKNQDKPFLFYKDQSYTYEELNNNSNRIARGILKLIKRPRSKIVKRIKISIMLPNCPEYIFCMFGIAKAGSAFITINPNFSYDVLEYILKNSNTQVLILDYIYLEKFKKISPNLPTINKVIIHNAPKDFEFNEKLIDFQEIFTSNIKNPKVIAKHWHTMQINYTSGSTGKPKGVLYRNHFVLTGINIGKELEEIGFKPSDKLYCPLPLYHASSLYWGILPALFYDASVVIAEHFNPIWFWKDIKRHNPVGILYFGAYLAELLYSPPSKTDRSHSIKWAFGCGASNELWEKFENRFGITIYELWTLAEAIGITLNKVGSKGGKIGSVGKVLSGYELRIVDSKGNIQSPGPENVGEILSRSILPMAWEYYKLSVDTLRKDRRDRWVHTGDYGYKDNDGYLYYVGNKADIIYKNEEQIFARQIERIANNHPEVLESAAFGVPSKKQGKEYIKICVLLKEGSDLSYENLYNYLIQNMAFYMVPRYIEFKENLPKSSNLMIQKFILKKEWELNEIKKMTWDSKLKDIIPIKKKDNKLEVFD